MIGRKINQYEILSKLGEGGMGVVYKAHDEKLDRFVALKFLPREMSTDPGVRKRFIQEARASSALDHPNISTVYEIGETTDGGLFIVMPCYEGETLAERLERGPLAVNEALKIAKEIADGLARAHDNGVVHRDIKPGNIMLVSDGPAKIMDFGLAMISGASRLTQDGTMLGTASYMSPEQAQGGEVDSRSDVWSLGAVLYEMLSGKAPFEADHHFAIMYSIINEEPEPLSAAGADIPFEVEQLVSKALDKDPARRFQSSREMADALEELREQLDLLPKRTELGKRIIRKRRQFVLRGISGAAAVVLIILAAWYWWPGRVKGKYPIVVLPFKNLTTSAENEMLSENVTEELTSKLSYIASIGVISNRTANQYRNSKELTSEIAGKLGVKAIVYGSIRESGNKLSVVVELIQVDPEQILWTDEFDRSIGEFPELYPELTRTIAAEIGADISQEEEIRLASSHKVSDEVYTEYMYGKHYSDQILSSIDTKLLAKAMTHYNKAISIDSTYAPARAGLARIIAYFFRWITEPRKEELLARARVEADLALELDPDLPLAYLAQAELLFHDNDFEGIKREYEKVLQLDRSPEIMTMYSGNFLTWIGEFTEAVAIAREAVAQEPVAQYTHHNLSWVLFIARRYDEALEEIRVAKDMFPGHDDFIEGWIYLQQRRFSEAAPFYVDEEGKPFFDDEKSWRAYTIKGIEADSLICIDAGKNFRAYEISRAYADLEYIDLSIQWLEEASEVMPVDLTQINSDPQFDVLRPDHRFTALMEKMGIPRGELKALENP